MAFELDPRIATSSLPVGKIDYFDLRLVDDERFFWALLIPVIENVVEFHDLSPSIASRMMALASTLGAHMKNATGATKINTAAIGNVVPQFHLHVVARHDNDAAWPAPVWGYGKALPASDQTNARREAVLKEWLHNQR